MVLWSLFNIVLPLLAVPLVRGWFWLDKIPKGFVDIVKDGQACFFCFTRAAATMSDMTRHDHHADQGVVNYGLFAMILMLVLALLIFFAAVAQATGSVAGAPGEIARASAAAVVLTVGIVLAFRWALGDF